LLVAGWQGFESFEEFDRMLAHTFKLTVFLAGSNAAFARPQSRMPSQ
jgi:hypothetical protein